MDLRILAKMTGQFRETIFILAILPCGADNVHNEVQGSVLVDCRAWNGMVHISRSFRDSLTALHVGRVGEINGYYYEQYYDNGMVLVPCVQSLCHRVNVWRNAWLVVCREDQDSGWWWWGEAVGRSVGLWVSYLASLSWVVSFAAWRWIRFGVSCFSHIIIIHLSTHPLHNDNDWLCGWLDCCVNLWSANYNGNPIGRPWFRRRWGKGGR